MKTFNLEDFIGGWFIGNFSPSLFSNRDFEVAVKYFKKDETEQAHFQKIATEITVVISGEIKINEKEFRQGSIILLEPYEVAAFVCVQDCALVCVKWPSLPSDKVLAD